MDIVLLEPGARIDADAVLRLESAIFLGEGRSLSVSLVVVGDDESRRINKEFLSHDYATDVIAFDLSDDGAESGAGELIVNIAFARREARARRHPVRSEFLFYVAHGLLHLLGYDDVRESERTAMLERQRVYLRQIGVPIRS